MPRRTSAQIQKQSNVRSTSLIESRNYKNSPAKNVCDANSRHLRHQNSFSGVSYLDVIKERERSDSGFSGDVYEEFSNEGSYFSNVQENEVFEGIDSNGIEEEVGIHKSITRVPSSTKTPAFPVNLPKSVISRRESYDSGLSVSPPANTPPQFHIELGLTNSNNDCPVRPNDTECDDARCEKRDDTAAQPPTRRKKKKRLCSSLSVTQFCDAYRLTGEILGEGSYGKVEGCVSTFTNMEYAVKIISRSNWHFSRPKMLKEIELYHLCQGIPEIIQLIEYFEEPEYFYLVFEKAKGGPLLNQIQRRVHFTEREAAAIVRDLAAALAHLHSRGIAHRDLKPENVLCCNAGDNGKDDFLPVKLCDFDLCSAVYQSITTPKLQSPVGSVEYMAPEVVEAFSFDLDFFGHQMEADNCDEDDVELTYDKRCDLWSLGIIAYILLCGYLPFSGRCGEDCGWADRGEECSECQHLLFQSIKSGHLVFPEKHWSSVSKEAKDLITKLLVRDASQRLDATSILNHPWIITSTVNVDEQSKDADECDMHSTDLETPRVLRKHDSAHEITFFSEFASNALAIKRNCDDHTMKTTLKKPMKKSATFSELLDGKVASILNTNEKLPIQEEASRGSSFWQTETDNNPDTENSNIILGNHFKNDKDQTCQMSNDNDWSHASINHNTFCNEIENPYPPKLIQRQESCHNYLTYPSPLSSHMKRQTSLVVFAGNCENGMDETECRWEF